MEANRKKDLGWCLVWVSYLSQSSSISWRPSDIFPQPIPLNSPLWVLYTLTALWPIALCSQGCFLLFTLTSAHGTIIYLPISSSHKTCLSGLHFILLHSNKLPSPIDFPYKYFLKPLHCSSFPLPKFPPPLSATSLSYQVLLFYWESLFFFFFFWNSLFNCFPKLNFLHSCPPIRTCSPLHTGAKWSITRRFWNILNIAYSALVSASISHHLLPPPYIQFLWLSSSGPSFLLQQIHIYFSLFLKCSFSSPSS